MSSNDRFENFKFMWQKESTRWSTNYVDIQLDSYDNICCVIMQVFPLSQPKDNQKATEYRNEGNKAFSKEDWNEAMRLYNKSLCFAEWRTENMALAYANRSTCFLKLGKFKECLIDIELAKKANYPKCKMSKLEARKAECSRHVENSEQSDSFQPKLSFERSEKFPSMANILEIKRNEMYGRHIVTKEDISVGQTVLIEKSFVKNAILAKDFRCNICVRSHTNLVPCSSCTANLFCVDECENHRLHSIECGLITKTDLGLNDCHKLVLRSIITAISTIPSVGCLMRYVEKTIVCGEPFRIPEYEPTDKLSRYRTFMELRFPESIETHENFIEGIHSVYHTLLRCRDIAAKFSTEKQKRFLKHLIAHHSAVIHYNSPASIEVTAFTHLTDLQPLMASYFNHSCEPNIVTFAHDDLHVAVAVRPIKQGEQLFVSYLGTEVYQTIESRQTKIFKHYGFKCTCELCKSQATLPIKDNIANTIANNVYLTMGTN